MQTPSGFYSCVKDSTCPISGNKGISKYSGCHAVQLLLYLKVIHNKISVINNISCIRSRVYTTRTDQVGYVVKVIARQLRIYESTTTQVQEKKNGINYLLLQ